MPFRIPSALARRYEHLSILPAARRFVASVLLAASGREYRTRVSLSSPLAACAASLFLYIYVSDDLCIVSPDSWCRSDRLMV